MAYQPTREPLTNLGWAIVGYWWPISIGDHPLVDRTVAWLNPTVDRGHPIGRRQNDILAGFGVVWVRGTLAYFRVCTAVRQLIRQGMMSIKCLCLQPRPMLCIVA